MKRNVTLDEVEMPAFIYAVTYLQVLQEKPIMWTVDIIL